MTQVTDDIKDVLVAHNVGVFGPAMSEWPIFIGNEPDGEDAPEECITLYDVPGNAPNPKWSLDYPRFMIRVRALHYQAGFAKLQEAKDVLLGLPSQFINGTRYNGVYIVVDNHFLKNDAKGRSIFINTWRCITEPVPAGNRRPL